MLKTATRVLSRYREADVRCAFLVTATPDVNLQSFVGKRIGVRGSRGFMPEYRRAHVMANRITPLEEKLVR